MNLQSLRQTLREAYLDDSAAPYLWSNELLNTYINEAQTEAVIRGNLLQGQMQLVIEEGVAEYPMADNVTALERLIVRGSGRLFQTSIGELDELGERWEERTGRPEAFLFTPKAFAGDGVLRIFPIPHAETDVRMMYRHLPAFMDQDGAEPQLPEHLHVNLLDWAAYRAFSLRDSDANSDSRASQHLDKFESSFGEAHDANAMRDRTDRRPHAVRMNRDYF